MRPRARPTAISRTGTARCCRRPSPPMAPRKIYILHNDATGQTIVIDKSTLLGRKPSMDVPEGAKAEKVEDPTRTTSRNHAANQHRSERHAVDRGLRFPQRHLHHPRQGRKRRCSRASRANSTAPPRCVSETSSSNSPSASSGNCTVHHVKYHPARVPSNDGKRDSDRMQSIRRYAPRMFHGMFHGVFRVYAFSRRHSRASHMTKRGPEPPQWFRAPLSQS